MDESVLLQVQSSNGSGSFGDPIDPRRVRVGYDWLAAVLRAPPPRRPMTRSRR